jgi:hypothetical protein
MANIERNNPKDTANFKGLSEKETMMSKASLNLLFIVYDGFPVNLCP